MTLILGIDPRQVKRYVFTVLMPPHPCQRGRRGHGNSVYTPKPTQDAKAMIKYHAAQLIPEPMSGPIELCVKFYFRRAKSKTRKRGPNPAYWHIIKPDADNVEKTVMDAMKGVAYLDDCQVCAKSIQKWVCPGPGEGDERPRIEIIIRQIEEEGA